MVSNGLLNYIHFNNCCVSLKFCCSIIGNLKYNIIFINKNMESESLRNDKYYFSNDSVKEINILLIIFILLNNTNINKVSIVLISSSPAVPSWFCRLSLRCHPPPALNDESAVLPTERPVSLLADSAFLHG